MIPGRSNMLTFLIDGRLPRGSEDAESGSRGVDLFLLGIMEYSFLPFTCTAWLGKDPTPFTVFPVLSVGGWASS